MSVMVGGAQVNKLEQVSSDVHQVSIVGSVRGQDQQGSDV